MQTKLS